MAELLIAKSDFAQYRNLGNVNYDSDVLPHVYKAQRGVVRDLLGDAQYFDLWQNQADAKYVTLLDGGTYTKNGNTLQLYGLKAVIVLYAFASFIARNDFKITRAGNKLKRKAESETADNDRLQAQKAEALSEGQMYASNVADFMSENRSTYPLYEADNILEGSIRVGITTQSEYKTVR
jgi:hypothetical protein